MLDPSKSLSDLYLKFLKSDNRPGYKDTTDYEAALEFLDHQIDEFETSLKDTDIAIRSEQKL